MNFKLTKEQQNKLDTWLREQTSLAIEHQKNNTKNPSDVMKAIWDCGGVYMGAIGVFETYHFKPTSIGMIIKVSVPSGAEIDLTDYDNI